MTDIQKQIEVVRDGLRASISRISAEYCSHKGSCGVGVEYCACGDALLALEALFTIESYIKKGEGGQKMKSNEEIAYSICRLNHGGFDSNCICCAMAEAALDAKDAKIKELKSTVQAQRKWDMRDAKVSSDRIKELEKRVEDLTKEYVAAVIESRNNYCPCCHARLDEIAGPCKFCPDSKTHLDTERSMYRAWRKRCEEAELRLKDAEKVVEALKKMLSEETDWEDGEVGVGHHFRAIASSALAQWEKGKESK
jgi:hypothetical protein